MGAMTIQLNELKYSSKIKQISDEEKVENFLKGHGFLKISGHSSYGTVWSHPSLDYVLKVFNSRDYCYKSFIDLVSKNPNEHFPRFKGKMMKLNDDYYAIRMEKLTDKSQNDVFMPIRSILYRKRDGDLSKDQCNIGDVKLALEIYLDAEELDNRRKLVLEQLFSIYPELKDACDLCISSKGNCRTDLHCDNVMFRGSTPIIIDPWAP